MLLDYVIKLKDAIENGLNFPVLPHLTDFVECFADVAAILLEVQQITQVEATDTLVLLVEFQWRYFFLPQPLQIKLKIEDFNFQTSVSQITEIIILDPTYRFCGVEESTVSCSISEENIFAHGTQKIKIPMEIRFV